MAVISYSHAIREAIREEILRDELVFLIGEDLGTYGGSFGVTKGLLDELGDKKIIGDIPIVETAIIGAAIGAAATGMRPIAEIMFSDFITCCMDELVNQAAKMRYLSGGSIHLPLTVRTAGGGGLSAGAQHSQCLESWFIHVPGLKVVMPSTPYDAKGLLKASIRDDDPVIFIEHKALYDSLKGEVPEDDYIIPLGEADVKREGKDITIIATQLMVHKALLAAQNIQEVYDISVEVVDPRTLVPFDKKTILASVKKTNRVIIVEEAVKRNGASAEISAMIVEEAFDYLCAPIKRIASKNSPIPFHPELESYYLPTEKDIIDAVRAICR